MEEAWKQYTAFTVGNLGVFQVWLHALWAMQHAAMFQQLMQNCLNELNLIYCLIYLDDIIIFSQTAESISTGLHIVFDQFREYNLKLKPSKCSLFKEEINYLAHRVSKEVCDPAI